MFAVLHCLLMVHQAGNTILQLKIIVVDYASLDHVVLLFSCYHVCEQAMEALLRLHNRL